MLSAKWRSAEHEIEIKSVRQSLSLFPDLSTLTGS